MNFLPQVWVATRQSAVQATEIDRWIRDSITVPYGIEVIYRQENHSGAATDYLYPPRTEQVIPVLRAFRTLCLESFAFGHQDRSNFFSVAHHCAWCFMEEPMLMLMVWCGCLCHKLLPR